MAEFTTKLLVNVISLLAVINLFPGIHLDRWQTAVIAAIVLILINAVLKPVILILTLPINILTLGLFTFIINAGMFYLVSVFVPGFKVDNFSSAFFGSIIFGVINFMLNALFVPKKDRNSGFHFIYNKGAGRPSRKDSRDIIDVEPNEDKCK